MIFYEETCLIIFSHFVSIFTSIIEDIDKCWLTKLNYELGAFKIFNNSWFVICTYCYLLCPYFSLFCTYCCLLCKYCCLFCTYCYLFCRVYLLLLCAMYLMLSVPYLLLSVLCLLVLTVSEVPLILIWRQLRVSLIV